MKKNSITYGVIKEEYLLNGKSREAYGIAAYFDAEQDGTLSIIASVHDISSKIEDAENIVKGLNSNCIDPRSLKECVEALM